MFVCVFTNESLAYLNSYDEPYGGFWQGIWHGLISCITLPLSVWFPQDIHVYNPNNNGLAYNIGFFIPAICVLSITIPFLIIAWIGRIVFWVIIFAVGFFMSLFS